MGGGREGEVDGVVQKSGEAGVVEKKGLGRYVARAMFASRIQIHALYWFVQKAMKALF